MPCGRHERDEEKHLLPRRDDIERRPAHAEIPELGHRRVVEREADDEHDERHARDAVSRQWPPG